MIRLLCVCILVSFVSCGDQTVTNPCDTLACDESNSMCVIHPESGEYMCGCLPGFHKENEQCVLSTCAELTDYYLVKMRPLTESYVCAPQTDKLIPFPPNDTRCQIKWLLSENQCIVYMSVKCPRTGVPGFYEWIGTIDVVEDAATACGNITLRYYDADNVFQKSCVYAWNLTKW